MAEFNSPEGGISLVPRAFARERFSGTMIAVLGLILFITYALLGWFFFYDKIGIDKRTATFEAHVIDAVPVNPVNAKLSPEEKAAILSGVHPVTK